MREVKIAFTYFTVRLAYVKLIFHKTNYKNARKRKPRYSPDSFIEEVFLHTLCRVCDSPSMHNQHELALALPDALFRRRNCPAEDGFARQRHVHRQRDGRAAAIRLLQVG